jgi:glycogen debranching enzyme
MTADIQPVPLQPLLDRSVVVLRAPTQAWSDRSGDMGASPIDGIYHGDTRYVSALSIHCDDSSVEWLTQAPAGPDTAEFTGLLRGLDDRTPDPKVRLIRRRQVAAGRLRESLTVASHLTHEVQTTLRLVVVADFASLHRVKAGLSRDAAPLLAATGAEVRATAGPASFRLEATDASFEVEDERVVATWRIAVPPRASIEIGWTIDLEDDSVVIQGAASPAPWDGPAVASEGRRHDPRLGRWLATALGDLEALRLALPEHPEDEFYAAGAPWFFTLFGRDSLWAARLALPLDVKIAVSTLRVLARVQGTVDDPATAQEPGKIMHELRATTLEMPGEGISLPPLYYGTVDATPLWVCLLVDAWRAGMPEADVRALLPALEAALGWIIELGDSDGDGFLDYLDRTGHGLSNQGWKDSGDSVQWRDGSLAEGPIALCEVQAYAYEAAVGAAGLLESLAVNSVHTPADLRRWAGALRERFRASFWVDTPEGQYVAIALDRHKRPVDTLTSNIGHVIGTGILDPDEEAGLAALLLGSSMSTGFGIRTMSSDAGGYWPLSYHGGSVWTHDTAICAFGLARAGLAAAASDLVEGMLAAAEGFDWRVPELHSGDSAADAARPTPYPAACRPQAWSAAAAITALAVVRGTYAPRGPHALP